MAKKKKVYNAFIGDLIILLAIIFCVALSLSDDYRIKKLETKVEQMQDTLSLSISANDVFYRYGRNDTRQIPLCEFFDLILDHLGVEIKPESRTLNPVRLEKK